MTSHMGPRSNFEIGVGGGGGTVSDSAQDTFSYKLSIILKNIGGGGVKISKLRFSQNINIQ